MKLKLYFKRISVLFMAVTMAAMLLPAVTTHADTIKVSVGTAEVSEGEYVEVPVYISSGSGVCGFDLKITYSSDLTLISAESPLLAAADGSYKDYLVVNDPYISYAGVSGISVSGSLLVLKFRAGNVTSDVTAQVSVSAGSARSQGGLYNTSLQRVETLFSNGTVEIKHIHSFVNGICSRCGAKDDTKFEIVTQPTDIFVQAGDKAVLKLEASGVGLSYQWQCSRDSGLTWSDCTSDSAKSSKFSFKMYASFAGRLYRCIVTDENQQQLISDEVLLTEPAAIAVKYQPQSVCVNAGSRASLSTLAVGEGTLSYQWEYSKDNGYTWTVCSSAASAKSSFSFLMYKTFGGRLYRCRVSDTAGNTVYTNKVFVTYPAEFAITSQPESITAASGAKTALVVVANGINLMYQWQYSKDGGSTWSNCSSSSASKATFSFTMYKSFDGRLYRCIVSDYSGTKLVSESAEVKLYK